MNISKIPKVVIEDHLFPFLSLSDILRFRRICKGTKLLSDDYLRDVGHRRIKKIEVEEDGGSERSLRRFLDLGFSVSGIHIKNAGIQMLSSDDVRELLEKHGSKITDLFVDNFECCVSPEELQFYQSFPNLQSVRFKRISLLELENQHFQFPTTFRNIRNIKVDEVVSSNMCPDDEEDYNYFSKLLHFCHKVEILNHPKFLWGESDTLQDFFEYTNDNFLDHIIKLVQTRAERYPDGPNLKLYDLKEFVYGGNPEDGPAFLRFCRACTKYHVKLANVATNHLYNFNYDPFREDIIDEIGELTASFQSVTNMHWLMFWTEGENLEEININSTAQCSVATHLNCHPDWPLRKLSIVVDSTDLEPPLLSEMMPTPEMTDVLFGFILGEGSRQSLEDLKLVFDSSLEKSNPRFQNLERKYIFPCPRAADIIEAFPNLVKLELKNWPSTNKALLKLWNELAFLEEICLDECQDVGNVTFVGLDTSDPVFLKMPCLKKLTLRNLDKMPKITDLVFNLVFRHLKLKQFIIHSQSPVKSVTVEGIHTLLTGEFANHIEVFPFNDFSLADVTASDFKQLEHMFRSSQML